MADCWLLDAVHLFQTFVTVAIQFLPLCDSVEFIRISLLFGFACSYVRMDGLILIGFQAMDFLVKKILFMFVICCYN